MRHVFIVALALGGPTPALAEAIDCRSPFGPEATHAGLVAAFGADDVTIEEEASGAEGEAASISVIYPDDPARRLEVMWWDSDRRERISNVTIPTGSSWVFGKGVSTGMSLSDLEALNAGPVTLNGFYWDYGGTVIDWKGGALGPEASGCFLGVSLSPNEKASPTALDAVSGDQQFASSDPKIKAVSPVIDRVTFGYPE